MSSSPTVVVKKGGVLTALVSGAFATLIVCILCGVGIGWYGLNIVDRQITNVFSTGQAVLEALPELGERLPIIAEALDDRRAPEYRTQLDVAVRVRPDPRRRSRQIAVVEVTNQGTETVTLMTARLVLSDEDGTPLDEYCTFIATPFTVDEDEWRGPLMPGSTRTYRKSLRCGPDEVFASIEVTELRVWNQGRAGENSLTAAETAAAELAHAEPASPEPAETEVSESAPAAAETAASDADVQPKP